MSKEQEKATGLFVFGGLRFDDKYSTLPAGYEISEPLFVAPIDLEENDTILYNPIEKAIAGVIRGGKVIYP